MTYPNLTEEHTFINFKSHDNKLKYARQKYVNCKFSSKIFSIHSDYDIVGFTLNQKKTKVIRLFYNKYDKPEGDHVTESVYYPIRLQEFNPVFQSNYYYA